MKATATAARCAAAAAAGGMSIETTAAPEKRQLELRYSVRK